MMPGKTATAAAYWQIINDAIYTDSHWYSGESVSFKIDHKRLVKRNLTGHSQ